MDLVSICIPTYNGADFLQACLASALAQTYTNTEILIVDDCSSDDTTLIARELASQHPHIRVLENEHNLGLVGNWNKCVQAARGEWIKFLFQDDLLDPECVQSLLAEAQSQRVQFVACDRDFLFDESIDAELRRIYSRNRQVIMSFLGPKRGVSSREYALRIINRINNNYVGEPTATLIHRSVFEQLGEFNAEFAQLCDVEFWNRVAACHGIAFVPAPLATFRVHASATSAVNRASKAFRAAGLDALAMLDTMLEQDAYRPLREIWQSADLLAKVERERIDRANEVMEFVRQHHAAVSGPDAISEEYAAFLARHPGCRVSLLQHLRWLTLAIPLRYKFRLGQRLNPLLPERWKRGATRPL